MYNLRAFDVEMLYIAQQLGMPIKEVPVNWQEIDGISNSRMESKVVSLVSLFHSVYDVFTGSKLVPFWSWLQMGRDILFIRLRYTFGIWKLSHTSKAKTN